MKKGVRHIESIVEEVAKEKNIPYQEAYELWRLHTKYVKELMDKDDCYVIHLGKLGNLYYNSREAKYLKSKLTKNKDKIKQEKRDNILNSIEQEKAKGRKSPVRYVQDGYPIKFKFLKQLTLKLLGKPKYYMAKRNLIKFLEDYSYGNIDVDYLKDKKWQV